MKAVSSKLIGDRIDITALIVLSHSLLNQADTHLNKTVFHHGYIKWTFSFSAVIQHWKKMVDPKMMISFEHFANVAEHTFGINLCFFKQKKTKAKRLCYVNVNELNAN